MLDIPLLVNLFISIIEIKNIPEKDPMKERTFIYLVFYSFNRLEHSLKHQKRKKKHV